MQQKIATDKSGATVEVVTHTLHFTATLKGKPLASLSVSDNIDDATYLRLSERLLKTPTSALAMAEERARLRFLLDQLALKVGVTLAELGDLYDFVLEIK